MGTKGPRRGRITVGGKSGDLYRGIRRPSRSSVVAAEAAEQLDPPGAWPSGPPGKRRRKDTRRWCRGHPGREHQPQTIRGSRYGIWADKCGPRRGWLRRPAGPWLCWHEIRCQACSKVLVYSFSMKPGQCPDWLARHDRKAAP